MHYRRLGDSGLPVSALSLDAAAGALGRSALRDTVALAWDRGVNAFDSAGDDDDGASEQLMGDVLADLRLPRDGFAVASRMRPGVAGMPLPMQRDLSCKRVRDACDAALRRLRVDYLDLFSCQQPDAGLPVQEVVAAMDGLVRMGKVVYWGTVGWSAARIGEARVVARGEGLRRPSMERPRYGLLERERVERELAPLCGDGGLGLTVGAPRLRASRLAAIAAEIGVAAEALETAWCLRNPHVSSVLVGAGGVAGLADALTALTVDGQVPDDTWNRLEALVD